jgi:16S rRNA processing protein RimM
MSTNRSLPQYVIIGRVNKPHGIHGAVRVMPMTDDPRRFDRLERVFWGDEDAPVEELAIERVQYAGKFVLVKFKDISSCEGAERFRNGYLQVPRDEALALPEGEHYYFELMGLKVYTDQDLYIGTVVDVQSFPANDVFIIHDDNGKEFLIPDVPAFIRAIDLKANKLVITPIDGLLDV